MPTAPPVRKAMRMARCSPEFCAAAATRTLPRTARPMPAKPTVNDASGAEDEEDRAADPGSGVVGRQGQQDQRDDDREDGEGLHLAAQVGLGALLHGERDLLHARGPGVSREDLAHEYECDSERQNGDHTDHCNEAHLASAQRQGVAHPCGERRHPTSRSASARSRARLDGRLRMHRRAPVDAGPYDGHASSGRNRLGR